MQIKSDKAGTPVIYALTIGLGFGLAYGSVRSFNLSLVSSILSMTVIVLLQFLFFRSGKKAAYSQAQAWAQNEVDIAIEVTNTAISKALALSDAYASAIATANATATNQVTVQLPSVEEMLLSLNDSEGTLNAPRNAQIPSMAMGEQHAQESTAMRSGTDTEGRVPPPLL